MTPEIVEYFHMLMDNRTNPQVIKQLQETTGETIATYNDVETLVTYVAQSMAEIEDKYRIIHEVEQELLLNILSEAGVSPETLEFYRESSVSYKNMVFSDESQTEEK